ncbi:RecQ family zinc-binding domain-containing protein [Prescottella equi]
MRGYAETRGCRRVFLLDYFGEHPDGPCGNCDRCDDNPRPTTRPGADPFPVDSRVAHRTFGAGVVIRTESDRVTVLFDEVGYRTLSLEALEDTELLRSID